MTVNASDVRVESLAEMMAGQARNPKAAVGAILGLIRKVGLFEVRGVLPDGLSIELSGVAHAFEFPTAATKLRSALAEFGKALAASGSANEWGIGRVILEPLAGSPLYSARGEFELACGAERVFVSIEMKNSGVVQYLRLTRVKSNLVAE